MDFRSPVRGTRLNASFAQGQRLRHEIYIDTGVKEENQTVFESLSRQKDALEEAHGRALQWEELPNARASRIADYRDDVDVTFVDGHDEFVTWFLDSGVRLRRALAAVDTQIYRDSGGSSAPTLLRGGFALGSWIHGSVTFLGRSTPSMGATIALLTSGVLDRVPSGRRISPLCHRWVLLRG